MNAWLPQRGLMVLTLVSTSVAIGNPPPGASLKRGEQLLERYFDSQCRKIEEACLADVHSRADWEQRRPELRRQFLEMIGLWSMPPRTDLHAEIRGKHVNESCIVENLVFQSSPGLYVTGNLYVPRLTQFPAPTVLYLCGHAPTVVQGVPYGNKVSYQHHGRWLAEHGYVCLMLDTLELGEVPGLHHGTYQLHRWDWLTLGYTPAGIECWNAMRALDYLQTRPEVDSRRIGVTGRSGGGATSWWVAAADDRPQGIIPVAGIADLRAHVLEPGSPRYPHGVITGHCDCMYFTNTYRWDFPMAAALCAPRPIMLGNSNADEIFPVPGYRRLVEKVRKIYELYGAADKFVVLETAGPHKDTPELRLGAFRWLGHWLQGPTGDLTEVERPRFPPAELKVLDRIPEGASNATIDGTFLKAAHPELPTSPAVVREWWPAQKKEWLAALREKVFRGWPATPVALNARPAGQVDHGGVRLRAVDFTSEEGVELRLWIVTPGSGSAPKHIICSILDETDFREWANQLGPPFLTMLQLDQPSSFQPERLAQNLRAMQANGWAFVAIAPRGVGPTRWADPGSRDDTHVRRRFALLGQTLDGQRIWDVRRGLAALKQIPDLRSATVELQGKGTMAGVALYASLFEPEETSLDLWYLPPSHAVGPCLLNVRRFFDMPQAVAMALPRPVRLHVRDESEGRAWDWPLQFQRTLQQEFLRIHQDGE